MVANLVEDSVLASCASTPIDLIVLAAEIVEAVSRHSLVQYSRHLRCGDAAFVSGCDELIDLVRVQLRNVARGQARARESHRQLVVCRSTKGGIGDRTIERASSILPGRVGDRLFDDRDRVRNFGGGPLLVAADARREMTVDEVQRSARTKLREVSQDSLQLRRCDEIRKQFRGSTNPEIAVYERVLDRVELVNRLRRGRCEHGRLKARLDLVLDRDSPTESAYGLRQRRIGRESAIVSVLGLQLSHAGAEFGLAIVGRRGVARA
ncbi:MAG TPA: hypothetical protein VGM90_02920 [Kofleriaceae bacterium]